MEINSNSSYFLKIKTFGLLIIAFFLSFTNVNSQNLKSNYKRERIKINDGWTFMRYEANPDNLIYDVRPKIEKVNDSKVADSKPEEAVKIEAKEGVLKNWILPSANDFIKDPTKKHIRPKGNPGSDFPFVQADF